MAIDRALGSIAARENVLRPCIATHHLWFEKANWVTAKADRELLVVWLYTKHCLSSPPGS